MSRCAYTDITPWTWVKSYAGTYRMTTDLSTYTAYVTDSFSGNHKWAVRVQDKTGNDVYSSTYGPHAILGYRTMKIAKAVGYNALMNLVKDLDQIGIGALRKAKRNG